jgi:hypothetical protein
MENKGPAEEDNGIAGKRGKGRKGTVRRTAEVNAPSKKATKRDKKTADELMMDAWKYTYETRHRRLTKP